jgi:hypothetical protein
LPTVSAAIAAFQFDVRFGSKADNGVMAMELLKNNQSFKVNQSRGQNRVLSSHVLLSELEEARQLALRLRQASAAVAATMGKAKILGLIIDRREVGDAGAFDHLTDEQLVEEAAKRACALGIAGLRLVNKKPH